jgi:hypothetical protein
VSKLEAALHALKTEYPPAAKLKQLHTHIDSFQLSVQGLVNFIKEELIPTSPSTESNF